MASEKTIKLAKQMRDFVMEGNEVIPMFFTGYRGSPATTAAAVRYAKKMNWIVEAKEKDGCGKPKYVAPSNPMFDNMSMTAH